MMKIDDQNICSNALPSISNMPGFTFVKDINSNYLDLNQNFAQLVGWKSPDHGKYKTDYEIPCPASEDANRFIAQDKQVINTKKKLLTMEFNNYNCGLIAVLAQNHPLLNSDEEVIGIIGQGVQISNRNLLKPYGNLYSIDTKIVNTKNKVYILNPEHSPLPLTPKQQSCVFLLIRGKGFKEIAYILNISVRTVESHIEAIKHKLGCYTKGQIIEKAIDSGFLYYIPEDFL